MCPPVHHPRTVFPRAADCRPYGVERGRSVIGGRGRSVIGGRADTQVGPYKTQGALASVRVPPQRPAEPGAFDRRRRRLRNS